ncbi:amidohydrolase [Streptomyces lincolnensis]|uniref:amidohydrolase n=1 Tax=Streptomyces lincolnensis TaxID=1915 RepID=UPI0037D68115
MAPSNRRTLLTAAAAALSMGSGPAAAAASKGSGGGADRPAADLILRNGRIAVMDRRNSFASAVAIRDGLVAAVGSDHGVLRLKGPETQVVDLQRRTVIPGLNDSHLHLVNGGNGYNLEVRWDHVSSLADGLRLLREQAERTPPGEWVRVVGGWSEFQFAERRMPTLEEINEVAPDTPVLVLHLYLHGLLNRAALRVLGYDKNTPNPPGGEIVRDTQGNPTGLLVARPAFGVLFNALNAAPKLDREQLANSTQQFLRELNRLGITSVTDGGAIWPADFSGVQDLHHAGLLTVRTAHHLYSPRAGQELADITDWVRDLSPGGDEYFRVNGVGEIITASAFDTGNMYQPRPDLGETAEKDLLPIFRLLAEHRWPFRIHATYNDSVSRILPVLEQADREIPFDGLRWVLDHAENITPRNIERVAALRGGISVQDRLAYQGEYFLDRYGPEEAGRTQPVKRIMAHGIPLGAGTDGTRLASYNPWVSLRWMITGRTVGGTRILGEASRLDRTEALRRYTVGGAWFSGEEGKKGSLEPGRFADLAVLSADYFSVPEDEISGLESVLTVTGGRIVHAGGPYRRLDPPRVPVNPTWSPIADESFCPSWAAAASDGTSGGRGPEAPRGCA